jgi:eukaryotic-like serine/threonine-protein kinase
MIGTLLLNRYELLEKIGEGGMGIVYKAKCHLLNRFVAVKILKAELSNDEDFVARFKREGNSAASLSHPNIVNIHDVGAENHINFIVMEYVNGKTLKQVIKENVRLSTGRTLEIALQIAKALECAHKNNIIHRDIKPDNILITDDNIVKVTDFGIAKVSDSETITNSNKVIGSVHYFSPEQAKGRFVDCRTDIYSLGIVMYEMVTGQVPYNAESSISVAMMHIQEPVIPPKEIITDVPENINQAILKAVEKEPIKRYQTAKEMAEILNTIREDSDFKVNLNNNLTDATKVMGPLVISDARNDFTTVRSQAAGSEKPIIEKNKKMMIIIALIILVVIIGVLGKYLSKGPSINKPTAIVKATVENKLVPSLIGSTQNIAENIIANNGFSLGNISNAYSDSITKGLVISQSPEVNTSYEKGGKIDLVISQGQKIIQVTVPQLKGKTLEEAQEILNDLQLKLGVESPVMVNGKGSKGNHSKNYNGKIFMQDTEPGTLVDIGTKINVYYYQSKKD